MKNNETILKWIGLFLWLGVAASARANYSTGFETTDGYTSGGGTVISVTDSSSGTAWQSVSGFSSGVATSTLSAQSGSMALRLNDSSTTGGLAASLDLASAVNFSAPFTLQFSLSITSVTATSAGSGLGIWFGNVSNSNSAKEWTHLVYDSATGNLVLYVSNSAGNSSQAVTLGAYTSFATFGDYMTFSLTIDPTTHQYTNITLSGSLQTLDLTSTVAAVNNGTIPWVSTTAGDPGSNLWFSTGSAAALTAYIDNVSIVPEPGMSVLLVTAVSFLLWARRSGRRSVQV